MTPKDEPPLALGDVARLAWMTIILTIGFLLGIGLANPVGFFYNIGWLLPFGSAPLIIYHFSKPALTRDSGPKLSSFLVTCLEGQAGKPPSARNAGRLEGSRVPGDGEPRPTVQGPS